MKRKLWKDTFSALKTTKARFISILCLIMLGSFALVGLKVTGPDMRASAETYFENVQLADLVVLSNYGLNETDQRVIESVNGLRSVEFGYLKDVVIDQTQTSIRILSVPQQLSLGESVLGELPKTDREIVLDSSFKGSYAVGDTIAFFEDGGLSGQPVLKEHTFTISGFITSGEYLSSVNRGKTTVGTGDLSGFAMVLPTVFDSEVYMIARLSFEDTTGISPYSSTYTDRIQVHKDALTQLIKNQPQNHLDQLKADYQADIDQGRLNLAQAIATYQKTKASLDAAYSALEEGTKTIASQQQAYDQASAQATKQLVLAQRELTDGQQKLNAGKEAFETGTRTYSAGLDEWNKQTIAIASKQTEYEIKLKDWQAQDAAAKQAQIDLDQARQSLLDQQDSLETVKKAYETTLQTLNTEMQALQSALAQPGLTAEQQAALEAQLTVLQEQSPQVNQQFQDFMTKTYEPLQIVLKQALTDISGKQSQLDQGRLILNQAKETLDQAKLQLDQGRLELRESKKSLDQSKQTLDQAQQQISENEQRLKEGQESFSQQQTQVQGLLKENLEKLDNAKAELALKQREYDQARKAFNAQSASIEAEFAAKTIDLDGAQQRVDDLELPVYSVNTRREAPGSDGYKVYESIASIVDSLANIFPLFFYFVAALVSATTMTRFVDEERTNSGTLKALGYSNRDIIQKFMVYGFAASLLGSVLGIFLGHTLMPLIVNKAYSVGYDFAPIALHLQLGITLIALVLGIGCALIPTYIVARRELREKPARLLQPKAPVRGSKIMLERIKPLWNRLSFTHKVVARNLFRYKKRMFMTVFGVCGSVALLVCGLGVQQSISRIADQQFGGIITYDMIVARTNYISDAQMEALNVQLQDSSVKQQTAVYYEPLSVSAGETQDRQDITLLVPSDNDQFNAYITLKNRQSQKPLSLNTPGVIISERLAQLLGVSPGGQITVQDANFASYTLTISAVTEMYIGHFLVMNQETYRTSFSQDYATNANLVQLNDTSLANVKSVSASFMKLGAVKGVEQNTTLINQINTIVTSLNMIMQVLIIVATLLAVVILYNLTNINVSERIRELSTIKVLGFFDKEVTLYIYRETILLSLLGIVVGYGFGTLLQQYIIHVVPPENVMFSPGVGFMSYLIPTIVILTVNIILEKVVNRRLKRVDMLEALKSVD